MMRATTVSLMRCAIMAVAVLSPPVAGQPASSWDVVDEEGVYWMRTPSGAAFFSKGVNAVHGGEATEKARRGDAYYWRNHFDTLEAWRAATRKRLLGWGFNTLGAWSDLATEFALPVTIELDLGRHAELLWSDPFHPTMPERVLEKARELTAPYRGNPSVIGYFTDNEVGWWNSPIFRWYLRRSWANYSKRVLWRLLHEHYAGSWQALLADFAPQGSLSSFEQLKEKDAALKLRAGGQGIQLINRFTYLIAGRYYELVGTAVREAHPEALVLGDRLPLYYNQDAVRAIADSADVISSNYNLDSRRGWVAPYYFEGLAQLSGKPVLVSEFFLAAEENRSGNRNERKGKPGHLMWVQTQAERAAGLANALCNFASFPNVVGTHWFKYSDEPVGGRKDGEDYNMGLVDIEDRPYELVTEVFSDRNRELEVLHGRAQFSRKRLSQRRPIPIQRAVQAIDVHDNGLLDWDLAQTRVVGFRARPPYAPFGDIHLAWTPQGLFLSAIASNYFEPQLLEYEGDFPLSETFRVGIHVQGSGGRVHSYGIHLLPVPSQRFSHDDSERFELEPRIYRYREGRPAEPMTPQGHVGQLRKPIPHISFEVFLPAEWLGMARLESEQVLRLDLVAQKFHNALSMALGDPMSRDSVSEPAMFTDFVLVQDSAQRLRGNSRDGHAVDSCARKSQAFGKVGHMLE